MEAKWLPSLGARVYMKLGARMWPAPGMFLTIMVGAPPLTDLVTLMPAILVLQQKKLSGCTLGSCNPRYDVPRMIDLYRAERLDLAGLITNRRPLDEINRAAEDLSAGRGIRTVLNL